MRKWSINFILVVENLTKKGEPQGRQRLDKMKEMTSSVSRNPELKFSKKSLRKASSTKLLNLKLRLPMRR
jgi:hypothetical protein